ncbi:MAG TPA: glutathione S-transferase family protein [Labilithrix sp.]|nr:glutathione S-transferase family protein [Labilithrix sp.]
MKLYFNPQSRATIAKWMLEECGASYDTVPISFEKKENKAAAFLAINPAGKLPALVDGDTRIFENGAIALYLGERFPEARLAPAVGTPERGRYLSLVVYATAQLEPAMGDALLKLKTDPSRGWTTFEEAQDVVERELGDGPYLFGDWFTLADVLIGSMFIWRRRFGAEERPKLKAYVDRLLARKAASIFAQR